MIDNLDVLDRIKYDESYKKMYDIGYIKALLIYLKENTLFLPKDIADKKTLANIKI